MWCKPRVITIAVWMDDVLGNGKRVKDQKWWMDHEYGPDGRIILPEKGTNKRDISPGKPKPENQRTAIYPAEDLPPGDLKECFPVDRKEALRKGEEAARPENSPRNAP